MRFSTLVLTCMATLLFLSPPTYGQAPGTLKWAFTAGDRVESAPAIGADGTVYVGSNDHNVYAVHPDGTLKWSFTTGDMVWASPAIGSDGTIYVGSLDYTLYAIHPDGSLKWSYLTGYPITRSAAIATDGTIYVGSNDRKLHALSPSGTLEWTCTTGAGISAPSIGADGTIYVGSNDSKLTAVSPDGTRKWEFLAGDQIRTSPAIGPDGTIYVGSNDHRLYALNPDGTLKWSYLGANKVQSSPAIGTDGTIYVGGASSGFYRLHAINPDGTLKWGFVNHDGEVNSSPAVGADGTVYVGGSNRLHAIHPDGTLEWSFTTGSGIGSSPAIGSDGTIYIGSADANLYAVYSDSPGLADSSWPKYRHDNRNTGRIPRYVAANCSKIKFGSAPDSSTVVVKGALAPDECASCGLGAQSTARVTLYLDDFVAFDQPFRSFAQAGTKPIWKYRGAGGTMVIDCLKGQWKLSDRSNAIAPGDVDNSDGVEHTLLMSCLTGSETILMEEVRGDLLFCRHGSEVTTF
jgi:outer membrane protein assembly factor BamB